MTEGVGVALSRAHSQWGGGSGIQLPCSRGHTWKTASCTQHLVAPSETTKHSQKSYLTWWTPTAPTKLQKDFKENSTLNGKCIPAWLPLSNWLNHVWWALHPGLRVPLLPPHCPHCAAALSAPSDAVHMALT